MLHNKSREFLVKMYQRIHDAEETAKTFETLQRQVYLVLSSNTAKPAV